MKKTLKIFIAAASLLVFVSCSNDKSTPTTTTDVPADQKVKEEKVTNPADTSKKVNVSVGPGGVNVGTKNVKVNVNTIKNRP